MNTTAAMINGIPATIPVGAGPTKKLPPSFVKYAACDIMTFTALCAKIAGKILPLLRLIKE
jgi:hypothetical protein